MPPKPTHDRTLGRDPHALREEAREILERPEHHTPPPGKEPHFNDEIPSEERRGNWQRVHGGGEPR